MSKIIMGLVITMLALIVMIATYYESRTCAERGGVLVRGVFGYACVPGK